MAVASVGFLLLRKRFGGSRGWKRLMGLVFLAWTAVIYAATLRRAGEGIRAAELVPLGSYLVLLRGGNPEILRSNLMNVILFYPAGLLLASLLPETWSRGRRLALVVTILAGMSGCIEAFQFFASMGRAETDDVIHNTIGSLLGAAVCLLPPKHIRKT